MPSWFHLNSPRPRRRSLSERRNRGFRGSNPVTGAPRRPLLKTEAEGGKRPLRASPFRLRRFHGRGSKAISAGSLIPALTNPARWDCAACVLHLLDAFGNYDLRPLSSEGVVREIIARWRAPCQYRHQKHQSERILTDAARFEKALRPAPRGTVSDEENIPQAIAWVGSTARVEQNANLRCQRGSVDIPGLLRQIRQTK
jgi:hypothetical protein